MSICPRHLLLQPLAWRPVLRLLLAVISLVLLQALVAPTQLELVSMLVPAQLLALAPALTRGVVSVLGQGALLALLPRGLASAIRGVLRIPAPLEAAVQSRGCRKLQLVARKARSHSDSRQGRLPAGRLPLLYCSLQ